MNRFWHWAWLFLLFLLPGIACADSHETDYGLVREGSFLLSMTPDTYRDGVRVHSLIGYLPTGTRVIVGDAHQVTNLKTSEDETYYSVRSELGVHGLIREDLLIKSNGKKLAVSIASFPIQVHQPNATLDSPRKRFTLGRHGGNYLEVTGETEPGFYDVVLHRQNIEGTNLPATEKARLKKFYVERGQVALLDPDDSSLRGEFDIFWTEIPFANEQLFIDAIQQIKERTGEDFDKIKAVMTDINDLQCLLSSSLNGELGFKIFSNGFSLGLDVGLKDKGIKYIFETRKLNSGSGPKYYSGIGVVKCDGLKPQRLQSFTIQEGLYSSHKRFSVTLADLEQSSSKWITTLQGKGIANKMVRISGWSEYSALLKELNQYAQQGNGYLSELTEKSRLILLNYIVSSIGFFEHRDLIIDQD